MALFAERLNSGGSLLGNELKPKAESPWLLKKKATLPKSDCSLRLPAARL